MEKGCSNNTCINCDYSEKCEVFKENKLLGYEVKRLETELKFAREFAIKKHKEIKQLQEEIKILHGMKKLSLLKRRLGIEK